MKGITPPNNSPPLQTDPRIDTLIWNYARLSEQVDELIEKTEKLAKRQDELSKVQNELNKTQDEWTIDAILDELCPKNEPEALPLSPASQGRDPPEQEKAQPPPTKAAAPQSSAAKRKTVQKHLAPKKPRKKSRHLKLAGSVAFYGVLLLLIVSALFIRATSNGSPRSLVGFTGMIVLTESMQSEIPKGSLVIAQQVDPKTLQIGDDITYMANQTTTVTHRIIGIIENYEDTGQRAFQTKGVMNAQPDKQPVPAANVVGKVVFHSVVLGMIAGFIGKYWMFLLFALAVIIGLVVVLKRIYRKEPKETAG